MLCCTDLAGPDTTVWLARPVDRDRRLLVAFGALALTGCTPSRRPSPTPAPTTPTPTPLSAPDLAVLRRWALAERHIVMRYSALVGKMPDLIPLRQNHAVRAEAVERRLPERPVLPRTGPLDGRVPEVVRAFVAAERALAESYLADLAGLADPANAVLGAELAAGARQHVVILRAVR